MLITFIILTHNEEKHIERAIRSCREVSSSILVLDSFSIDETPVIAKRLGATVILSEFENQAHQFNKALTVDFEFAEWIFRLDADEFLSDELIMFLNSPEFALATKNYNGITFNREYYFLGKKIRWGGVFPIAIMRLFRTGYGRSEIKNMDEHIIVEGPKRHYNYAFVDDNKKDLKEWILKHIGYAERQIIDDHSLQLHEDQNLDNKTKFRRDMKKLLYSFMPEPVFAILLFIYRYFLCLGFLDGWRGFAFHFLQCFWYRIYIWLLKRSRKNTGAKLN